MQPLPPVEPETYAQFPLDGVLERNKFSPGVSIVAALILGFIAFQGISLIAIVVMIFANPDAEALSAMDPAALLAAYPSELLIANTIGQFLGLLGFGWLVARLHSSRPLEMLRVRGADVGLTALSLVGLVALIPIVQWLGTVMDGLPWPEWIRDLEQVQLELIEQVLAADLGLAFTLFTMALTPALCEELFFRGYIQRQTERVFRSWVPAVVLTGVVFGLYHLRLTQALPLSLLGIYMAYVVWRSNSLVPGILVHLANNGIAVAIGAYIASSDRFTLEEFESMQIPWYVIALSTVVLIGVLRILHARGAALAAAD